MTDLRLTDDEILVEKILQYAEGDFSRRVEARRLIVDIQAQLLQAQERERVFRLAQERIERIYPLARQVYREALAATQPSEPEAECDGSKTCPADIHLLGCFKSTREPEAGEGE